MAQLPPFRTAFLPANITVSADGKILTVTQDAFTGGKAEINFVLDDFETFAAMMPNIIAEARIRSGGGGPGKDMSGGYKQINGVQDPRWEIGRGLGGEVTMSFFASPQAGPMNYLLPKKSALELFQVLRKALRGTKPGGLN